MPPKCFSLPRPKVIFSDADAQPGIAGKNYVDDFFCMCPVFFKSTGALFSQVVDSGTRVNDRIYATVIDDRFVRSLQFYLSMRNTSVISNPLKGTRPLTFQFAFRDTAAGAHDPALNQAERLFPCDTFDNGCLETFER
jgi:hypothetical protein